MESPAAPVVTPAMCTCSIMTKPMTEQQARQLCIDGDRETSRIPRRKAQLVMTLPDNHIAKRLKAAQDTVWCEVSRPDGPDYWIDLHTITDPKIIS